MKDNTWKKFFYISEGILLLYFMYFIIERILNNLLLDYFKYPIIFNQIFTIDNFSVLLYGFIIIILLAAFFKLILLIGNFFVGEGYLIQLIKSPNMHGVGLIMFTSILLINWMSRIITPSLSGFDMIFYSYISLVFSFLILFSLYSYYFGDRKIGKIIKILLVLSFTIILISAGVGVISSYQSSSYTAERTGPSANVQWQGTMSWARENSSEGSVFAHWWDYGYWVQTLGERATIADGGHFQGSEDGNHKIGRYVLTTPNPETAYSYFKSMNVTHLLIDQTDLGKYPAYSKIGGGEGETELDRYSAIPVMPSDPRQTTESANGTQIVFSGGMYLFEDIVYEDVFLPAGKAVVAGIVMNIEGSSLGQPEAVYIYNNAQTRIPMRYAYIQGELIDFGKGLDVVVDVIPGIEDGRVNTMGAAIYLSQKVSKSLFAQVFLLDDAFGNYEDLELVHVEDDQIVASLKAQGAITGDFVYYNGFRGPIKIWDVSGVGEDVEVVPEFWEKIDFQNVGFGSLDGLFG